MGDKASGVNLGRDSLKKLDLTPSIGAHVRVFSIVAANVCVSFVALIGENLRESVMKIDRVQMRLFRFYRAVRKARVAWLRTLAF